MRKLLLASVALVLSAPAYAATLNVTESVDAPGGDFADTLVTGLGQNVGTAMPSNNFVSGDLMGQCGVRSITNPFNCGTSNNPNGDAADSFSFTIDAGFEITRIGFESEAFGPTGMRLSFTLANDSFAFLEQSVIPLNTQGEWTGLNYGAGDYILLLQGSDAPGTGNYEAFWNMNIEVSAIAPPAIPLPAGLPLLAAGLGAFGIMRRRQRG